MKKISPLFLLAIFGIFAVSTLCSCEKVSKKGKLIVATYDQFQPFVYHDQKKDDAIIGFDIELAGIIAEHYDRELQIKVFNFDDLIDAVESGVADMAICGISITEERKRVIDFSLPYHKSSRAAVVLKDNLQSFEDIRSKEELGQHATLGAMIGTTSYAIAKQMSGGKNVFEGSSHGSLLMDLLDKRIDAIIMDDLSARLLTERYGNITILPIRFDIEYYGIVVSKGNHGLLSSIDQTLYQLINSGEYMSIVEKYMHEY